MKKSIVISSVLALSIIGTGYYFADQRIVKEEIGALYNHAVYEDADQLAKDVSLIIEATPTSINKETVKTGDYTDSYTVTEVKVNKVFKNTTGKEQNPKTVPVIERFFTVDNGLVPGKTKILADEYSPLLSGQKYVLFLNWSEENQAYWIHALNQGKINIDGSDLGEKSLAEQDDRFMKLKDSALKKFK
ncbi:hypothetical protein [Paenibacillus koleovorans]|uniref:hypothetical protein n=1 Tax=Paenibacillus koleovorans TaxID=121608 RepID=UPI000FD9AE58|nr:hypothetical protein [Paenibacillus koleovorans]